jgi:SHAQKYF class myb-like DNA-binding protein
MNDDDESVDSASARKKQRFIWSDELHMKFVASVFDYGLKSASPKFLLQLMEPAPSNLSTEHIKSHLQKYRVHSQVGT